MTGSDPQVTLVFAGDIMLGRLVNRKLREQPCEYPWGDALDLIRAADWQCCNLECVLSDVIPPEAPVKIFRFRSAAANVAVLRTAGIKAVSLGNNHTLDMGRDAMLDMVDILDRAGIAHSGAGGNLEEASRPAITEVKGVKIAMLSFTDNEPGWAATTEQCGIFYAPIEHSDQRATYLLNLVRETRLTADVVVVSAHWGSNWGNRPPPSHPPFAHRLIDAGANLVYGHSPHVFRGIEIYRGSPIFYSTGDLIDDYAVAPKERNDCSLLFFVTLENQHITRIHLVPTVIHSCQVGLAPQGVAEKIAAKMQELSEEFGTRSVRNHDHSVTIPVTRLSGASSSQQPGNDEAMWRS